MEVFTFEINGEPVPKSRPRFDGRRRITYTPEKTRKAENEIKLAYLKQGGKNNSEYAGAIGVDLCFNYQVRKSWTKNKKQEKLNTLHIIKPDLDNLEKTVLDALNGLAWKDDSQVAMVAKCKRWSNIAKTKVTIYYLDT